MRTTLLAWLAIVVASLLTGCTTDSTVDAPTDGGQDDDQPSWIDEVTPRPDASLAPGEGVSVRYQITDPDHEVRLIVDGVDVTAVSEAGPGFLRYDEADPGPVQLAPGDHSAEARLVTREVAGVDVVTVDSFVWTFRLS